MGDKARLFGLILVYMSGMAGAALVRSLRAMVHRWTYKGPTGTPKTVVVVGGSFSGTQLMRRLADLLPTGWQVVLVEKNSHFNYSFDLPRFSVIPGYERAAFIPYGAIIEQIPLPGIVRAVQGEVVGVELAKKELKLASGTTVPYDILVVSTGSAARPPAKLLGAADRDAACAELRVLQDRIRRARTVAVVGGGAVGVELAADIKTFAARVAEITAEREGKGKGKDKEEDVENEGKAGDGTNGPSVVDKEVTLVHSRPQLLNRFGARLHEHVSNVLTAKLGLKLELGQRPTAVYTATAPDAQVGGAGSLHFSDGREEAYDCILLCTGLSPNSAMLKDACPGALLESGEIRVTPTLQVAGADGAPVPDVFAFGDVAATGGPKMARGGYFQAEVVAQNVMEAINGRPATTEYTPSVIESAIKLTLGKDDTAIYLDLKDGESILLPKGGEREDMDIKGAWRMFLGVPYQED